MAFSLKKITAYIIIAASILVSCGVSTEEMQVIVEKSIFEKLGKFPKKVTLIHEAGNRYTGMADMEDGTIKLIVTADGENLMWQSDGSYEAQLALQKLGQSPETLSEGITEIPQTDTIYKGKGSKIFIIDLNAGHAEFDLKCTGNQSGPEWGAPPSNDNFIADLKNSNGQLLRTLANAMGDYEGQDLIMIPATGRYTLDISAAGKWSIHIK
jgi:hypothetical protein